MFQKLFQFGSITISTIELSLELHDILHAIVMRISSVKTVLWLAVNLHQLFSDGAAFNTEP